MPVTAHAYGGRTRKGLADALSGSGLKLVEDEGLVLQETLTRFGLSSHHQRELEVQVRRAACACIVASLARFFEQGGSDNQ